MEICHLKITGGLQLVCGRPSPLVLPWLLRHFVVWFAWKIPNSQMHYLRNIEIKIKTKIKQTLGLTEIATLKF